MNSRFANPTCEAVEKKIADLEHGVTAMCTSSGQMASLLSILNLCNSGDSFVSASAIYGGTINLFAFTLKKLGIECKTEIGTFEEFFDVFRAYFSDQHAESTITDYINRIKTFRNKYAKQYLIGIYGEDYLSDGVEVGHIYENIEHILATFKPKSKTELNMYSALKKLNEYKNHRERE